jgi:MFS family permease
MSVMGALVTEDSFLSVFPRMRNAGVEGIVIAIFEMGALLGSLSCLEVGDRLGRRATVWCGMAFMVVGGTYYGPPVSFRCTRRPRSRA